MERSIDEVKKTINKKNFGREELKELLDYEKKNKNRKTLIEFLDNKSTPPIIEVKNLSKYYNIGEHNEVHAISDISFKINEGDFVAVVGPSGSGKSTLLHMIGCLDTPTEGKVFLDGKDVSKLKENQLANIRHEKIGFIFQTFNLIPNISAYENVTIPLVPFGVSREKKKYAEKLLDDFGLDKRMNHVPSELSGGEKQRVSVARSLINKPHIILADEPTGQLDSKTGKSIVRIMRKLNEDKGLTFLMVTHDETLLQYVKRVIRLKDGKVISDRHNGELKEVSI